MKKHVVVAILIFTLIMAFVGNSTAKFYPDTLEKNNRKKSNLGGTIHIDLGKVSISGKGKIKWEGFLSRDSPIIIKKWVKNVYWYDDEYNWKEFNISVECEYDESGLWATQEWKFYLKVLRYHWEGSPWDEEGRWEWRTAYSKSWEVKDKGDFGGQKEEKTLSVVFTPNNAIESGYYDYAYTRGGFGGFRVVVRVYYHQDEYLWDPAKTVEEEKVVYVKLLAQPHIKYFKLDTENPRAHKEVLFSGVVNDVNGIWYIKIDWGDGTSTGWDELVSQTPPQGTAYTIGRSHVFENAGSYRIKLIAKDYDKSDETVEYVITINVERSRDNGVADENSEQKNFSIYKPEQVKQKPQSSHYKNFIDKVLDKHKFSGIMMKYRGMSPRKLSLMKILSGILSEKIIPSIKKINRSETPERLTPGL